MLYTLIHSVFLFCIAFFVSVIIAPICIKFLERLKAKQTTNEYVDFHVKKSGTVSMGGIIFILSTIITSFIFVKGLNEYVFVSVIFTCLFGLVGFIDDLKKAISHKNDGLKPWQKIVMQVLFSAFLGIYLYKNGLTKLNFPFINFTLDLGFFVIFFAIIFTVFMTNSVNLTDGLDGLASSITTIVACLFGVFLGLKSLLLNFENSFFAENMLNLVYFLEIFSGAIFGFILYNFFPAKIFMGDTGSLALGGMLATVSLITGDAIYLLIFGVMFVLTSLSTIIQVAYYKLTKKRIFLMAPFHHHLEKKGIHETKIVIIYFSITLIISLLTIFLEFLEFI